MALDILEWGVILVMGAGILVYGPDKIPEMAKSLAAAKKQFDGATKQIQGITKELQTGINSGNLNMDTISNAIIGAGTTTGIPDNPTPEQIAQAQVTSGPAAVTPSGAVASAASGVAPVPLPPPVKKSSDQMLIEMARSLRIDTKGMTKEEISKAIMDVVAVKPPSMPAAQAAPTSPAADTLGQAPALASQTTGASAQAKPADAEQTSPAASSEPAA
jgi:Sec-independent protein translocase protein TatA